MCNATSHACVACANDTQCKNDTVYGQHTICLAGACTTGDCHDISSDCSAGRICGSTVPHACGDCGTDAQCKADTRYLTGYICVGNLCAQGDCHDTSNDCTTTKAGLVCGADAPHACGTCNDDDQCTNDAKYGANTICTTTTGLTTTGKCVSNACTNTGHACSANGDDVCCGSKCLSGNCCVDNDCLSSPIYGDGYFCRQNTCSRCDSVVGNAYFVDPVAGDDSVATGSGAAGGVATAGCSFRTVTRALQTIGTAPAGTTITIVGRTTGTTSLYTVPVAGGPSVVETLPIQVPANVTITTKTGPVNLTLANNKIGFSLLGDKANLQPLAAAALTIDGAKHVSASGIVVNAGTGTANISNVTVINTGDDGIQVAGGTAQIGAGVHVTGAGTVASRQDGLLVSGGIANIVVAAAGPNTVFENNTQYGIAVTGAGVLNITGAAVTGGQRTIITQSNVNGNVDFGQTPVATTPVSTIDGLYCWASTQGDGLRILAGSKVKVRNSVFQANTGNGIHIYPAGGGRDQQPGGHRSGEDGSWKCRQQRAADRGRKRSEQRRWSVRGLASERWRADSGGGGQSVRRSRLHRHRPRPRRDQDLDQLYRGCRPRRHPGDGDNGHGECQHLHPARTLAPLIEFLPSPSLLRGPSAFSLLGQIRRVSSLGARRGRASSRCAGSVRISISSASEAGHTFVTG
jgi:hypothetical protein